MENQHFFVCNFIYCKDAVSRRKLKSVSPLSLSNIKPRGNYRLYFNGHGELVDVEVSTESGSRSNLGIRCGSLDEICIG